MKFKCLQFLMLAAWLSLSASATAQSTREASDHPSHRYLPPPRGKGTLTEQINSLEQLNRAEDAITTGQKKSAPLELTPSQLQQLDSILESFRGENGELNIPSPESVPKQWIDSLLPDPKQRQQAKDMLEEYSRKRNIPLKTDPSAFPPIDAFEPQANPSRLNEARPNDARSNAEPSSTVPSNTNRPGVDRPERTQERNAPSDNRLNGEKPLPSKAPTTARNQSHANESNIDEFPKNQPNKSGSGRTGSSSNEPNSNDTLRSELRNIESPSNQSRENRSPLNSPRNQDPSDSESFNNGRNRESGKLGRESSGNASYGDRSSRTESNPTESSRTEAGPAGSGAAGSGEFELPQDTPPALRDLFETLKKFQQQNSLDEQPTRTSPAARPRSAPSPPRKDSLANRPTTPNAPVKNPGNSSSGTPNRYSRPNANSQQGSRLRSQPQTNDSDAALRGQSTSASREEGRETPSDPVNRPGAEPSASSDASNSSKDSQPNSGSPIKKPPTLTPFDEGYDFSTEQKVPIDPFAPDTPRPRPSPKSATKPSEPFNVTRMSQQPQLRSDSSRSPSANTKPRSAGGNDSSDWKKSVNDYGLAPALKSIVEKTLREQGFDPKRPGDPLGQPNTQSNATAPNSNNAGSNALPSNLRLPGKQTEEQLRKWANSVTNNSNNSANNPSSGSNSNWGKWVSDTWKSVAESPRHSDGSTSSAASSPSSPAGAAASSGFADIRWTNSMTMAVLIVVALILLIVWFSRRRVAELSDTSAAQAEWIRTVIAQGLKTRADVVRAFHQLVKQSRAVSDWWTHRSIVKHFSTQSPQLASAINELAGVYEQARYFPEDVELSPQQLAQVRVLLESVKIPTSSRV